MGVKKGDKLYLVKYALTAGIEQVVAAENQNEESGYIYLKGRSFYSFLLGRDVFTDLPSAIAAAETMREKKIKSIEKQIAKLRKLDFCKALA
ncbi:MAG: hypothetical protein BroJett021_35390 [Chloroflexota bacterium]|nr:MAG: hypothetical protein BroJett021_35390 [Chloroflexota bacterium]